jgi:hypothetical protein
MESLFSESIAPQYRQFFQDNEEALQKKDPDTYLIMHNLANTIGIETWQALMVNNVVDFYSYCTSIVARMSDGTIIHGRNLDFDFPSVMQ